MLEALCLQNKDDFFFTLFIRAAARGDAVSLAVTHSASPRYVVQRRHAEAGHHGPAPLLGQQLVPHHLLGFERMLRLFPTERQRG